jgi:hypothetical protein
MSDVLGVDFLVVYDLFLYNKQSSDREEEHAESAETKGHRSLHDVP